MHHYEEIDFGDGAGGRGDGGWLFTPSRPVITFDVLCAHGDTIVGNELRIR